MQQLYWGENIDLSYSDQNDSTESLKVKLSMVRKKFKSRLTKFESLITQFSSIQSDDIRSEQYRHHSNSWIRKVKSLSCDCNKGMVDFTWAIINEAIKICGSPPCEFVSIGIGSIATG